jgi:hypothetical protein
MQNLRQTGSQPHSQNLRPPGPPGLQQYDLFSSQEGAACMETAGIAAKPAAFCGGHPAPLVGDTLKQGSIVSSSGFSQRVKSHSSANGGGETFPRTREVSMNLRTSRSRPCPATICRPMPPASFVTATGTVTAGIPATFIQAVNTACPRGPTGSPSISGGKMLPAGHANAAMAGQSRRSYLSKNAPAARRTSATTANASKALRSALVL